MAAGDRADIARVVATYAKAIDDKDYELLDTLFTPDARMRYQMDERETDTTYPQMRKQFDQFTRVFYLTQHVLGAPVISVDGDRATAESKLIATHVQNRKSDGARNAWYVHGFYRDELVRSESGWRICARVFRSTHTEGELLPPGEVELYDKPPWR